MVAVRIETLHEIYLGEVNKSKQPNGKGIRFLKEQRQIQQGWWLNGILNGRGRVIDNATLYHYVGDYQQGQRSGRGVDTWRNGN